MTWFPARDEGLHVFESGRTRGVLRFGALYAGTYRRGCFGSISTVGPYPCPMMAAEAALRKALEPCTCLACDDRYADDVGTKHRLRLVGGAE